MEIISSVFWCALCEMSEWSIGEVWAPGGQLCRGKNQEPSLDQRPTRSLELPNPAHTWTQLKVLASGVSSLAYMVG